MSIVLKRKYIRPSIEVLEIDREISLVMMTSETQPPDEPYAAPAQQNSSQFQNSTLKKNPFKEKK